MKMKTVLSAALALTAFVAAVPAQAATFIYVGFWSVGDGPSWTTNPKVYTGQEAAALLFGGTAADYAISTVDDNDANINFRSHVDGWGETSFLFGANSAAQDFSLDTGGGGYNSNPGTGSAYSAYVRDHSSPGDASTRNYAFRVDMGAVPEPATWAMMILGFGMVGGAMRQRRRPEVRVKYA